MLTVVLNLLAFVIGLLSFYTIIAGIIVLIQYSSTHKMKDAEVQRVYDEPEDKQLKRVRDSAENLKGNV